MITLNNDQIAQLRNLVNSRKNNLIRHGMAHMMALIAIHAGNEQIRNEFIIIRDAALEAERSEIFRNV